MQRDGMDIDVEIALMQRDGMDISHAMTEGRLVNRSRISIVFSNPGQSSGHNLFSNSLVSLIDIFIKSDYFIAYGVFRVSVSVILTAAVYIACREAGIPKTLKEITVANNTKHKLVAKAYRVLVSELGVKLPTCDPMKCVVRVANKATIQQVLILKSIRCPAR
jgi:hypothetical protein